MCQDRILGDGGGGEEVEITQEVERTAVQADGYEVDFPVSVAGVQPEVGGDVSV